MITEHECVGYSRGIAEWKCGHCNHISQMGDTTNTKIGEKRKMRCLHVGK